MTTLKITFAAIVMLLASGCAGEVEEPAPVEPPPSEPTCFVVAGGQFACYNDSGDLVVAGRPKGATP